MDGSTPLPNVTGQIASWVSTFDTSELTDRARQAAAQAVLDWTAVTRAGATEPLVDILVADALKHGEGGASALIGRRERLTPAAAALVNGAASHALDYDDINKRLGGHPTVAVLPAILSVPGLSGAEFLEALIIGIETACTLGEMMGHAHYLQGFHITATVGSVAAAAGAARAMRLDAGQCAFALAIAASQAAGLKANFGTMTKPLHAGKAAQNGLLAARWAAAGFTGNPAALEASQGFGLTLSPDFRPQPVRPDPSAPFGIEENVYKYHAACYFTHSAIEAAAHLQKAGTAPDEIAQVKLRVPAQHRLVCDIERPATGMEVKFSIRHLVAMALSGVAMDDPSAFSSEMAHRSDLIDLRDRIVLEPTEHNSRMAAEIMLTLHDGRTLTRFEDVSTPAADLAAQADRLGQKARGLIGGGNDCEALIGMCLTLNDAPDLGTYLHLAARPAE